MCTESETGKKHARRWMDKARTRISRKSKHDRPLDLRSQIQSRALVRDIVEDTAITVTPVLAFASAKPPRKKREYNLFATRHEKARVAQELQELQAIA